MCLVMIQGCVTVLYYLERKKKTYVVLGDRMDSQRTKPACVLTTPKIG